jgi:hypothetical protein
MIDGFIFNKSVLIHVHTLQMKLSCMSKKRRCFGVVKDAFAKEVRGFQKGKVVQYGEPCKNVIPRKGDNSVATMHNQPLYTFMV